MPIATGIRIVGSSDNHDPEDEELSDSPDFKDTFPPHCLRGTEGQARIPETVLRDVLIVEPEDSAAAVVRHVANHGGDILFHKHYFDVFTNPSVEGVVEALAIDEVVLYGVALDVCNRYAVEGLLALDRGIAITVVTDAVRAINEAGRDALLAEWQRRGVALACTRQVVS